MQFVDLLEQLVRVFTLVALAEDLVDRVTDLMVEMSVISPVSMPSPTVSSTTAAASWGDRCSGAGELVSTVEGCWVEGELVSSDSEGCCVAVELLGCGDR